MRANTYNDSLWQPFLLAVGVHLLLAALVVLGTLNWQPFKQHKPQALTIEAVIVDTTQLATRRDEAQKEAEAAQKRQELEENRAEELEKQKQRERDQEVLKQQQQEREKQQAELEQKKRLEAQKLEKQKQLEVDKQKQVEAETQRIKQQEDEARKKKEAQDKLAALRKEQERKREEERVQREKELEQVRKQQEEAEKKRKLEEERLKQLEAREKAQEDAKLKQQQEDALLAEKERQAQSLNEGRKAELGDKYTLAIQQLVRDNWLRPPTARPGLRCILKIVQIPGGEVISAHISGSCNADEATKRSIVAAVERVEALPYRGFEEVFAREIDFEFKYEGD